MKYEGLLVEYIMIIALISLVITMWKPLMYERIQSIAAFLVAVPMSFVLLDASFNEPLKSFLFASVVCFFIALELIFWKAKKWL